MYGKIRYWYYSRQYRLWFTTAIVVSTIIFTLVGSAIFTAIINWHEELMIYFLVFYAFLNAFLVAHYAYKRAVRRARIRHTKLVFAWTTAAVLADEKRLNSVTQRQIESLLLIKFKEDSLSVNQAQIKSAKKTLPKTTLAGRDTSKANLKFILWNLEQMEKNEINVEKLPLSYKLATDLKKDAPASVLPFFKNVKKKR